MMADTQEKAKQEVYFVWTKTERAGHIVQIDESQKDSKWTYFTDGTRINKQIMNEYLLRTTSLQEAKGMSKTLGIETIEKLESISVPTVKIDSKEDINKIPSNHNFPPVGVSTPNIPQTEVNVMMTMLEKMSAKNKALVPIEVNLPAKSVYDLLKDQMDVTTEDLNEQITLLVQSQINNLQEKLKQQIQQFIINYYENESTNTTTTQQKNKKSDHEAKRNAKDSEETGL